MVDTAPLAGGGRRRTLPCRARNRRGSASNCNLGPPQAHRRPVHRAALGKARNRGDIASATGSGSRRDASGRHERRPSGLESAPAGRSVILGRPASRSHDGLRRYPAPARGQPSSFRFGRPRPTGSWAARKDVVRRHSLWVPQCSRRGARAQSGRVRVTVLALRPGLPRLRSELVPAPPLPSGRRTVAVATWNPPLPDLFVIDRGGGRRSPVVVRIYSGESGFHKLIEADALPPNAAGPERWMWEVARFGSHQPDVMFVKRRGLSGKPELHVL